MSEDMNNGLNQAEDNCEGISEKHFYPPTNPGEIVVVPDDEGNPINLEYLGLVKFAASDYGIFFPVDFFEGDSGEVVILKLVDSTDEGETFQTLDNIVEFKAVYQAFKEGASDYYDFSD